MEDWLKNLWREAKQHKTLGLVVFVFFVVFAILNVVATISDIGFADEIKQHRILILAIAAAGPILFILVSFHVRLYRERNDLEQQQQSAFRLMKHYKEEAQEDIFNRLKQLATFSLQQSEWQKKGAKIERFRIGEASIPNDIDVQVRIAELTTVIINLGTQDGIMKGMRFVVQDPNDSQKYGVIAVKEVLEKGAQCGIVEMSHQAFWYEVGQALTTGDGKSRVLEASANVIVPHSALKEMNQDSARQLLEWLQTVEDSEL
jgi:hypothetical protein